VYHQQLRPFATWNDPKNEYSVEKALIVINKRGIEILSMAVLALSQLAIIL
jgi:hypothetical protein